YISVTESQYAKAYALSDMPVNGIVTGTYEDTELSDDSYEVITEIQYTGHPRKTYSYLEHKWDFNVAATGGVTFKVEAYRPNSSDGDDFTFAYSIDDITYYPFLTVASATEQTHSASLPNDLNGTVYIRVTDTDRNWGNVSLDQIYVNYMYIEYDTTPAPPVADFSGSPILGFTPLTVNFTDQSTGNPTSWSWDFGDDGTSSEQNPSYTYEYPGDFTVTLTAANAHGSDVETKIDYITVTDSGDTMYVHDMVVGRRKTGPNYIGTCTVTIYDNGNQPVPDATVSVTAMGPTGDNYEGVTGPDGSVYFETSSIKKPLGEWCFEVNYVTHGSYPDDNTVTKACESG
ncbi:MAG: PKD domain-containing protein, partial [Gammaproteobacteria bacterium]|nr:PKD domain-containing protein [Gammaproteobacteria bacterium]